MAHLDCAPGLILLVCATTLASGCGNMQGARALPPLPRGSTADVNEIRYDVRGTTVDEIRVSLRVSSRNALRRNATGLHTWNLRYSYRYAQHPNYCEMTEVTITLASDIELPIWVDQERADSTLVGQWDEYITALRAHEYGHRENSYRAAREINRELLALEVRNCVGMTPTARPIARRILDKYRRLNVEFDAEARGTITWPPRRGSAPF